MKQLILFFAFTVTLIFSADAQTGIIKAGGGFVYFDGIEETFSGPMIAAEAALGNHFSLNVHSGFFRKIYSEAGDVKYGTKVWHLEPEARFYIQKGMKGFFLGVNFSYSDFKSVIKSGIPNQNYNVHEGSDFGVGAAIGLQANLTQNITLGSRLGFGVTADEDGGAKATLDATIGYRF